MTKICTRCKRKLDESNFNWKIKDIKLAVHCKDCSRKYIREHYKNNLQYYLNKAKKRRNNIATVYHKYIGDYLSSHPCMHCVENNILVLEFDHKNTNNNKLNITTILTPCFHI